MLDLPRTEDPTRRPPRRPPRVMRGIRVRPLTRPPLPTEGSSFVHCFAAVLDAFASHHWLVDTFHFPLPDEWVQRSEHDQITDVWTSGPLREFWRLHNGTVGEYAVFAPGFLPRYAPYVPGERTTLFALREPLERPDAWLARRFRGDRDDRAALLEATVDACFFCVDDLYWAFYTADQELLTAVGSAAGERGLEVEPALLRDEPI